jgi:hypothetical protein
MGFKDPKKVVLHVVLLMPGLQGARWHTYVDVRVPTGMLHVGARSILWRIFCLESFCAVK